MLVQENAREIKIIHKIKDFESYEYGLEQIPNEIGGRTWLNRPSIPVSVIVDMNFMYPEGRKERRVRGMMTASYTVGEHTTDFVRKDIKMKFQAIVNK